MREQGQIKMGLAGESAQAQYCEIREETEKEKAPV
jgi:hypothetical protein